MKNKKFLSILMVFVFSLGFLGNLSYADDGINKLSEENNNQVEENTDKKEFSFTAKLSNELDKNIKVTINGKDYTIGDSRNLEIGKTHRIKFDNIPEGYGFTKVSSLGFKSTVNEGIQEDPETKVRSQEFAFEINDGLKAGIIVFNTTKDVSSSQYKVFIDTPKTGDKQIKIFGKPNIEYSVTKNITQVAKGTFDKNGSATVQLDEGVSSFNLFTVMSGDSEGFGTVSTVGIGTEKDNLISLNKIEVGDTGIQGEITMNNGIFASFAEGLLEGYVYDLNTNTFIKLENPTVEGNSFEFKYEEGFKNGDVVYLAGGTPLNMVHKSQLVGSGDITVNQDNVKRISGLDRFDTSVEIAKNSYSKPKNVVIANGMVSADALSVGPLANELNAPILLVNKNDISNSVLNYIENNNVEKVFITGGVGSVSKDIENKIGNIKDISVARIAGSDRFETSLEISKILIENYKYNNDIVMANGFKDADALVAAAYATQEKKPIVLVPDKSLNKTLKDGLESLKIKTADIAGGISTVPNDILNGTDITRAKRLSGENRYETSLAIAKELKGVKTVIAANGYKSADALSAASLSKTKNAAIILTSGEKFETSQKEYIKGIKSKGNISTAYLAGGTSSVTNALEEELKELLK